MRNLYERCLRETDSNRKGLLFEEFVAEFFRRINGFSVEKRFRTAFTDLDVVVHVRLSELIVKCGNVIVIQCKNVEKPLDYHAILELKNQAEIYGSLIKMAVLATTSKLTDSAKNKLEQINRKREIFIVAIEGKDWESFLRSNLTSKEFFDAMIRRTPKKYR